jgi:hypothetical protein
MAEHAPECESYRYALFHCRRGQMDARTRIQGNKACGPLVPLHWFAIALLVLPTVTQQLAPQCTKMLILWWCLDSTRSAVLGSRLLMPNSFAARVVLRDIKAPPLVVAHQPSAPAQGIQMAVGRSEQGRGGGQPRNTHA